MNVNTEILQQGENHQRFHLSHIRLGLKTSIRARTVLESFLWTDETEMKM